jgi:hypothetical protein
MRRLGLNPQVVIKHSVPDGIAAARETIRRSKFDAERCAEGIEALKQYRQEYDEKRKVFKDVPLHDWASHPADAFRYLSMAWREPKSPMSKRDSRSITRARCGLATSVLDHRCKLARTVRTVRDRRAPACSVR